VFGSERVGGALLRIAVRRADPLRGGTACGRLVVLLLFFLEDLRVTDRRRRDGTVIDSALLVRLGELPGESGSGPRETRLAVGATANRSEEASEPEEE